MLQGELDEGVAAVDAQFGADEIAAVFDGAHTDAEFVSDLTTGEVLSDEREHLAFVGSKRLETFNRCGLSRTSLEEILRHLAAGVGLTLTHGMQTVHNIGGRTVLQYVTADSEPQGL